MLCAWRVTAHKPKALGGGGGGMLVWGLGREALSFNFNGHNNQWLVYYRIGLLLE